MREMILLGAGASIEAGIPGTYDMTRKIIDIFRNNHNSIGVRVLDFVIGGLLFKRGMEGADVLSSSVNVEELFNAVQLLADRYKLEASPFVGSWHSVVEELDQIPPPEVSFSKILKAIHKGVAEQVKAAIPQHLYGNAAMMITPSLESDVNSIARGHKGINNLSRAIGGYISDYIKQWTEKIKETTPQNYELERELNKLANQIPKPGQGRIFKFVAEQMIQTLIEIVLIKDTERINYFYPLINHVKKHGHMYIATLNYDNTIEMAAEKIGVTYNTGITEWSQKGKFCFGGENISLLKLHGSIDWEQGSAGGNHLLNYLEVHSVDLLNKQNFNYYRPAVIFGDRNKLTAEGPFLDLLYAFIGALDSTEILTIIGYSFGDPHINAILSRWGNGSRERKFRIVNPEFKKLKSEFTDGLMKLGADRVTILEQEAGLAIAKMYLDN
jgi:hypothetical protein